MEQKELLGCDVVHAPGCGATSKVKDGEGRSLVPSTNCHDTSNINLVPGNEVRAT